MINNLKYSVSLTLFSETAMCKLRMFPASRRAGTVRSTSVVSRLYYVPRSDPRRAPTILSKLIVVLLCPSRQIGGIANIL